MPTFQTIPRKEAELETATGVRAQRMKEYLGYLDQVGKGQAGRLTPDEGETATAMTRRLRAAAETAGVSLVVKRVDDAVYFWRMSGRQGKPRRLEIWFHLQDDKLYLTGSPGRRGWYANLLANPSFTFHLKQSMQRDIPARATPITDQARRKEVLGRMRTLEDRMQHVAVDEWVKRSPLVEVDLG